MGRFRGGAAPEGAERSTSVPMVELGSCCRLRRISPAGGIGGVSWGGLIGLELALAAAERVNKLLLVDAACRSEDLAAGRYAAVMQPVCRPGGGSIYNHEQYDELSRVTEQRIARPF